MENKFWQTKEFKKVMIKVDVAAKASKVNYALIGGNAFDIYVNPPVTKDIDVLIFSSSCSFLTFFLRTLKDLGVKNKAFKGSIIDGDQEWLGKDCESGLMLDLIITTSPFGDYVVNSASRIRGFKVASPSALIIMKLMAAQDPNRDQKKDVDTALLLLQTKFFDKEQLLQEAKEYGDNGVYRFLKSYFLSKH